MAYDEKRKSGAAKNSGMMIVRKFFYAISRDWGSLVTGIASIPLTLLAFWANTPIQRIAWILFALTCFTIASFRIWVAEYRRAERAKTQLTDQPRPWVTIDGCEGVYAEDDQTGEECLVETLHIVNRGGASAVSIEMPPIQLIGRTARLLHPLPTLGPGQSTDAQIINLQHVLRGVCDKVPKVKGRPRSVRIPLTVEYRDLNHGRWTTDHAITYNVMGISFGIAHSNEPEEWTDISALKQLTSQ